MTPVLLIVDNKRFLVCIDVFCNFFLWHESVVILYRGSQKERRQMLTLLLIFFIERVIRSIEVASRPIAMNILSPLLTVNCKYIIIS
jgi:hypothetical protein